MEFLKKLASVLSPKGGHADPYGIHFYVQCDRCGAVVDARADRRNDISRQYEGESAFVWRKGIMDDRCFQLMRAEVHFDDRYNILSQDITGGRFITKEEYQQSKAPQT